MNLFRTNKKYEISNLRLNTLQGVIFLLLISVVVRLFYLQILQNDYYIEQGLSQRYMIRELTPERGRIWSLASSGAGEELYPLAINKVYYDISVNPLEITRPQNIADILVEIFEVDKDIVLAKISKEEKSYELVAKGVTLEKLGELKKALQPIMDEMNKDLPEDSKIENIKDMGFGTEKNVLRYYPDNEIGAHILGFLGYANDGHNREGKYGLEGYFDLDLAGSVGKIEGEKDVDGRLVSDNDGIPVQNGIDLVLTIDRAVQYEVCKRLEKAVARYDAESGTVIVMETKTGAIRAMCNYPSFDPNHYNEVESHQGYNNKAVYDAYEPGSVMKSVSIAIALNEGYIVPETTYKDEGEIKFSSGQRIRNAGNKKYGMVDMKEVLASSINTGAVFATADINNKIFEDYMKRFGFGQDTELQISQEAKGDISSLAKSGDIFKATASYGQGITVTPLQMLNAFNTLANRGNMMKPYIINHTMYEDEILENFEAKQIREVVSKKTASQISAMMVHVVDSGHAGKAAVEGYYVAGKTGTAQAADPDNGKYFSDKFIHNFVGFAPNDNPKFTMITKLDFPKAANYSSDTAAPLFGEIAKFLLEYYQIPPTR